MHVDFQSQGTGAATAEATDRVMYDNAADQLVAVDARIGTAPGFDNYLHSMLTFDTYCYDALGRRVFTQSQRQCPSTNLGVHPGADFFVECNLGYVQRTVWDGSKELYDVRMPDQSQHWEKDGFAVGDTLGVVNNNATDKIIDRDAFYGRVGYVYGGAIDKPLVMLRQDYGDRNFRAGQNPKPYRRFQPFALYPQWDLRGEPSLGTSADGGISRCEMDGSVKRCTYAMVWTQVWAPNGKPIDPLVRGWAGSLLQDKREPNGLLYRRNRYLDPATGRFTQPDPIGIAGGLNAYGYANGDPVSFADPFGLCPDKDDPSCAVGEQIKSSVASAVDWLIDKVGSAGNALRNALPSIAREVAQEAVLAAALPVVGEIRSARRVDAVAEATGKFLTENRHVRGVIAVRKDWASIGATADGVSAAIAKEALNRSEYLVAEARPCAKRR